MNDVVGNSGHGEIVGDTERAASALKKASDSLTDVLGKAVDSGEAYTKLILNASDDFAKKSPGRRGAYLGFLLLVATFVVEILEGFKVYGFEFSDAIAYGMLVVGTLLVMASGFFDIYFSLKLIQAKEAVAESLERSANEAMREAREVRKESRGMIAKLLGD